MTVTFTPGTETTPAAARYKTPKLIRGWRADATCPECGGLFEHVADCRPSPLRAAAVARCTDCGCCIHAQFILTDVTHEIGRKALW